MAEPSYLKVASKKPLLKATMPEMLAKRMEDDPDKIGFVFWAAANGQEDLSRRTLTFRQLADDSLKFAAALLSQGFEPGDRIAIFGKPSPEWIKIDLAVLRIKVLLIRLPEKLVFSDMLGSFLKKYRCRTLVVSQSDGDNLLERIRPFVDSQSSCKNGEEEDSSSIQIWTTHSSTDHPDNVPTFTSIMESASSEMVGAVEDITKSLDPEDIAYIYPTSGSTGIPKLIGHNEIGMVNALNKLESQTIFFNDRLFSWVGSASHVPIVTGCRMVHIESTFTSQASNLVKFFKILADEKVMFAAFPVYIAKDILQGLANGSLVKPPFLMAVSTSGENVPTEVREQLLRYFAMHMLLYSTTESNPICIDVKVPNMPKAPEKDSSVTGDPNEALSVSDNYEVKIVNEEGEILPRGEPGTIVSKSTNLFAGYLDDPDRTGQVLDSDGWYNTEDAGIMHESGKLQILGRNTDVISKGDVKIYPISVERILLSHPQILQAYVCGVPDERYVEDIGACVVLLTDCHVTEKELSDWCTERCGSISGISLVPAYIAIVDEIKVLASGKVDRLTARALLGEHQKKQ